MKTVLYGLFPSRNEADGVTRELSQIGIPREAISIINQNAYVDQTLAQDKAPKIKKTAVEGLEAGGAGGATAGIIGGIILSVTGPLGLLSGVITVLTTGVGGSIIGAITGGVVGALVGVGFPEHAAKSYEQGMREGKILLGTTADKDAEEKVRSVYTANNGEQIQSLEIPDEEAPKAL